ncbi:aldo/keto reductase [Maricaulis sp. CAU 1757]
MPQMRKLGTSGLETPTLVLGGNVFNWTARPPEAFDILDKFVEAGGTMIDTADVYSAWVDGHSGGESERLIGEWLKRRGRRDDVLIATKVGMLDGPEGKGLAPEHIAAAAERSLNRLQTDYIDLYYAHQDDDDQPMDEVLHAFAELVDAGKVRVLGCSNFDAGRIGEAIAMSTQRGWPAYQIVQPELNLMKPEGFSGTLQNFCIGSNLGVLTYFGLASGFLTGKYRSREDLKKSPRGGRMEAWLDGRGRDVLAALDAVAAETGATPAQISLAWCARQPGVTAPIASATSLDQLDELLGAMSLRLEAGHMDRLDTAAKGQAAQPAH